jgi:hypothetical protein
LARISVCDQAWYTPIAAKSEVTATSAVARARHVQPRGRVRATIESSTVKGKKKKTSSIVPARRSFAQRSESPARATKTEVGTASRYGTGWKSAFLTTR